MTRVSFYLLGAPRIELAGAPIVVDTRKAIALAIYLAVTGHPHQREQLAGMFWPEADSVKAGAALRRTLSVLNKALNGLGLAIDRETVSLLPADMVWVDTVAFQNHLLECQRHGHLRTQVCPACSVPLTQAVALHQGGFLSGFSLRDSPGFDDWQFFQSESLRRELAEALERLVRCLIESAELESAINYARRWLALDPIHEPAHRQLMWLYARAGQRAAALRQYQECVRLLDQELGVPPLEETTLLFETIKSGLQSLHPPEAKQTTNPSLESHPPIAEVPVLPLIGRSAETATLHRLYATQQAQDAWAILEGEAGVGKTRLAESFLAQLPPTHTRLTARCYEGELNLAYGPFVEALRSAFAQPVVRARLSFLDPHWLVEAARLLPDLSTLQPNLSSAPPLDSPGAQSRFFEGLTQTLFALGGGQPLTLLIDDVQWMDPASLDLFAYLIRRLGRQAVLVLTTWRTEGVPPTHRIRHIMAEAQRLNLAHTLSLARFDRPAVAALLEAVLPTPADNHFVDRLFQETEGLPLFLIEYLAALQNTIPREVSPPQWPLPASVRSLLQSRLALVNEAGRQLLSTAAVIGRSFDFDTLQAASGRSDEEILGALETLLAHGLIREVPQPSFAAAQQFATAPTLIYDFSHDKLRTLVYDDTSLARRHLLHRRVAEVLAARLRSPGPLASQVALHYRLGGRNLEAAHYFKLAGEHARLLYANAEALSHFQAALALGHPEPAALHESIGDLQTLMGDYPGALTSYQTAAALGSPNSLAELERKLGLVYERRGDGELAERHFEAALAAIPEGDSSGIHARLLAEWSLTAHHRGQTVQALDLAHQSLAMAEAADDQRALAQAHNILGILASSQGDFADAHLHLQHSLVLAESLGDPSAQIAALNNLALSSSTNNQLSQAVTLTERALGLCAELGDRHREAALHNNLADLLHTLGQSEASMQHLKQAVILFAEIGVDMQAQNASSQWQPEIWKLTEW